MITVMLLSVVVAVVVSPEQGCSWLSLNRLLSCLLVLPPVCGTDVVDLADVLLPEFFEGPYLD